MKKQQGNAGAQLVAGILALVVVIGISIMTAIFGWGLEVKSWGWVIGGPLLAGCIGGLIKVIAQD